MFFVRLCAKLIHLAKATPTLTLTLILNTIFVVLNLPWTRKASFTSDLSTFKHLLGAELSEVIYTVDSGVNTPLTLVITLSSLGGDSHRPGRQQRRHNSSGGTRIRLGFKHA